MNPIRAFGHNRLPNMSSSKTNPGRPQKSFRACLAIPVFLTLLSFTTHSQEPGASNPLPAGVEAVWDPAKAVHETTATREKICVNGLWQWQPADAQFGQVPTGGWGYFKVPGAWPGITDYMQKDSQRVFAHPDWVDRSLSKLTAAWYQRTITVPASWSNRRIALSVEYLNSYAAVFIDGNPAGEIQFPGGEVDLTRACQPGGTYRLSLLTVAMPLKGVMLSYTDSASAREVKGSVARRGLCGDVHLIGTPTGPRITDVRINPSVRKQQLELSVAVDGLSTQGPCTLRARVNQEGRDVREFTSAAFESSQLKGGRLVFTEAWMPQKLWDTHTPQNKCTLELSLLDAQGRVLDTAWPIRFGFRELWIEGRDFYLNGTRLHLSAVPFDNAQVSAATATYAAARESMERLRSFGINFVYTHNYGCEPGTHLGFTEILRAADDVGMLVSFSQPHFSHYDWQALDAERTNGYARHAAFYVRTAQNHPSVAMYSMSHNATGYSDDMNPDMMDGVQHGRDNWALRNAERALKAEAIVNQLDPGRIVYHHASGNLGSMHPINFYPNFVPVQELSDWFGDWATHGTKPVFTCEYGAPFTWDWTMYRGWYQGEREFGSAQVPWEFCLAEWNSQFFGDTAFQISEPEKTNLRWEAEQFRAGRVWHRWDYPFQVGSTRFDERYPVFARYLTDNFRAFRTWGVSANSPWEHGHFWKLREGVDKRRKDLPVDWQALQRPGFSPDFQAERYERMDLAFERDDWIATPAADALMRNNRPLLAYIAGKTDRFTSKDHNFVPGEPVEKQLVVINDTRETVTCEIDWSINLPNTKGNHQTVTVVTGQQKRIPLRFTIPFNIPPGRHEVQALFHFSTGETQRDHFSVDVLPAPEPFAPSGSNPVIALFDPLGQTGAWLQRFGIAVHTVHADADLSNYDLLIIGKSALTVTGAAPDIRRVRDGLKVIVFEQGSKVLEQRFGFRVVEYGLREVFARIPDHPLLRGIQPAHLRDWRGDATVLPDRLDYAMRPRYGPTVTWCDIPVTRAWRCGNRGNVASVLIEKPACGDFLPIVDGGYSLQYSPLMEYREGLGLILFCQMDVTARTESDPVAERLTHSILKYTTAWQPSPRSRAVYAGAPAGRQHLESAGLALAEFQGEALEPDQVLVVAPGAGPQLTGHVGKIREWLASGGHLLALGIDGATATPLFNNEVTTQTGEHIAAFFEPPALGSFLQGIGPADVHNRDPRNLPLVISGLEMIGDGVLGVSKNVNAVLCQLMPWTFDARNQTNQKRTFRRVSFLVTRLLANMGASGATPLLDRFSRPLLEASPEKRWSTGLYLDTPAEWDDPYRFFRW